MGITTYTPTQVRYPMVVTRPTVEVKAAWSGQWQADPTLDVISFRNCCVGQDLGEAQFGRRYGMLRHPWENATTPHAPVNLANHWIRILDGSTVLWTGIVADESRELFGTSTHNSVPVPAGNQTYTAFDPMILLRRIYVSGSDWLVATGSTRVVRMAWSPDVNSRDAHNTWVGNRTSARWIDGDPLGEGCYLFGGTDMWSRWQFCEYILQRFADKLPADPGIARPMWRLDAPTAVRTVLDSITDNIRIPERATVADVLRAAIPISLGIDYRVVDWPGYGFKLSLFSLSANDVSDGTTTLPANQNQVIWNIGNALDLRNTHLAVSDSHRYSKIRVLGKRMVVCFSLRMDAATPTLEAGWESADATAYLAGTGTALDEAEKHDNARRTDLYRDVFQRFKAPVSLSLTTLEANPTIHPDGSVTTAQSSMWQNTVRRTLNWLPLDAGIDYSDSTGEETGELIPPMAWVKDPTTLHYVPVDTVGIGLSVLPDEWGIRLAASPNHRVALNHWSGANDTTEEPVYDYDTLSCTIAIETDQRMMLEYTVDPDADDGSVLVLEDNTAEFWYLAPGTIVGTTAAGAYKVADSNGEALRNDSDRLAAIMAGAIARYQQSRGRAVITLAGWHSFSSMVGQVLTLNDGVSNVMSGPVTSVRWTGGDDPTTTIAAGFADGA